MSTDALRAALVRRGLRLNEATLAYNALEALAALAAGLVAGSVALVGFGVDSAIAADAAQTSLCAYLSVIALAGVALNAAFGWWWADPVAALAMVPIIAKEGAEGVRGEQPCDDCAH